jgi:hypothetical protein
MLLQQVLWTAVGAWLALTQAIHLDIDDECKTNRCSASARLT